MSVTPPETVGELAVKPEPGKAAPAVHSHLDRSSAPSSIYIGLSERSKLTVLTVGALIASVNLLIAWYLAHQTQISLRLDEHDMAPFRVWINSLELSQESRYELAARSMHIVALSKMIANKQGLVLACFGGAFSLAAIGFALFVIGADGAFKVSGNSNSKAKIVLSGTAPGLLCFAICGFLITKGVDQKSSIELPGIGAPPAATQSAEKADCAFKDFDNRCYSTADWQKKQDADKGKK